MTAPTPHEFEHLNVDCTCVTLDRNALCAAAEKVVGDPAFCRDLEATHPHLLSAQPLFLSGAHVETMRETVAAVEAVARMPAYRAAVLAQAPDVARFDPGAIGVFMGYDFHLGPDGPRLIEINTNAGGGLINAYLMQAQRACCADMEAARDWHFDLDATLAKFVANFRAEWTRQKRRGPLRSIAVIDKAPREQYLYPEFVLFQRLFQAHGLIASIAAPDELEFRDGGLWIGSQPIDLVYNRLTDFTFATPECGALREAYLSDAVVVSPNPRAHALFANKANLALLTDPRGLADIGVDAAVIAKLIAGIPRTEIVRSADAKALWARRGKLFFKPCAGFGSKGSYRGDKITRKVWEEILAADYVAQEIVQPSARTISIEGQLHSMKVDLRNYTYDGQVQLIAARFYQGQTTNFRTPGGGFAPVFVGDDAHSSACHRPPT